MDYQAIKNALGALLTPGTYTFPDGSTAEALSIQYGAVGAPPEGTRCEGLEVTVIALPNYQLRGIVGGQQITRKAAIELRQWDVTQPLSGVDGAIELAIGAVGTVPGLLIDPNVSGMTRFEQLDNIETATITVSSMESHA